MSAELSVVICTHNPRPDYLRRVLEALRAQTLPLDRWELIVVDNVSAIDVAEEYDLSWHPRARHVRESELGLAYARQRGIREAAGGLLVFVDDDNVLDADYLERSLRIARDWPRLAVWGGSIVPDFETPPPYHLNEFIGYLTLREVEAPTWANIATCIDAVPCGAGMLVRSVVARAYSKQFRGSSVRITGRTGSDLISGEDSEFSYVACEQGFGVGVFPGLRVTHLIPEERVTDTYLLGVIAGIRTSADLLAFKWKGVPARSPLTGVELLRTLWNLAFRRKFHRRVYWAEVRGALRARQLISAAAKA